MEVHDRSTDPRSQSTYLCARDVLGGWFSSWSLARRFPLCCSAVDWTAIAAGVRRIDSIWIWGLCDASNGRSSCDGGYDNLLFVMPWAGRRGGPRGMNRRISSLTLGIQANVKVKVA
jgi:hypothetical protein